MFCEKCGKPLSGTAFCENCGHTNPQPAVAQPIPPVATAAEPAAPVKRENVVTGIVGAIIGAALGAGSIILLNMLGYVASISGLILAICTLKGYELLGGKLSIKGVIVSLVLFLVTPYIADRLSIAIMLTQELGDYGITFGQAFQMIPELLEMDSALKDEYIGNLVKLYLFVALGGGITIFGAFKKK